MAACAMRCTARLNTVQDCTFIGGDDCHAGPQLARNTSFRATPHQSFIAFHGAFPMVMH